MQCLLHILALVAGNACKNPLDGVHIFAPLYFLLLVSENNHILMLPKINSININYYVNSVNVIGPNFTKDLLY